MSIIPRAVAQHADIGVLRGEGRRQRADNVAVVVGIDAAVGKDVAQDALIGVAVRIDEARNDNAVGGIDHGRVLGHRNVRAYFADLAVLDQHVRPCEVAELTIERQHYAASQ
jgi:hypothetical protein